MDLVVQVPDEIAQVMRVPESERKRRAEFESACALYAQGVHSGGKAAQLAGMQGLRFGEELAARNIAQLWTYGPRAVGPRHARTRARNRTRVYHHFMTKSGVRGQVASDRAEDVRGIVANVRTA